MFNYATPVERRDKMKMKKHRYKCITCNHQFDAGILVQIGFMEHEEYNERCPSCESWNYCLTNLSMRKLANGVFAIDYSSPSLGMTLFCSPDEQQTRKAMNRLLSLKWDVFLRVLDDSSQEISLYLSGESCLMNNYHSHQAITTQ